MAAKKNPLSDKAHKLYESGMKLIDIAAELKLPPGTVRRWKSTYGWKNERSETESERSDRPKAKRNVHIDDGTKETLQNEELTPEQQMFCIYYSRTFNATQSYIKAYGCAYESAMVRGSELLRNVKVKAELERLKEIKRRQIVAGAEDIVELQMRIAFCDIGDVLNFGKKEVETKHGNVVEINGVDLKESAIVDTQLIQSIKEGCDGVSVKLKDSQKAIEWLTKYFLIHPDDKYKAEFDRKRAEVKDNSGEEIMKNMQTIADILQHPAANRSIADFEEVQDDE